MTGSLSVMAGAILKSFTALVSDIGDELEVIGTCSLGGVDVGVGDAEVLDADEDCSTCCTGGGGAGRGGRGLSQGCLNASVDVIRFDICLTRSLDMKSLASAETSLNASSSKSYLAMVTLAMVSTSVSPMNGERPESKTYPMIPTDHMSVP